MAEEIQSFDDVLRRIGEQPSTAWIYLPANMAWTLKSKSAVLDSEEVPASKQDEPDAGMPQFARTNNLKRALPITVAQDIVENARAQKPGVDIYGLFEAFMYYYDHDAFMKL